MNPAAPLPEEGAQSSSNSKSNEHLAWLVQEGGGVGGQPSMQKQEQGLGQTACSVRGMEELLAAIEVCPSVRVCVLDVMT